MRKITAIIQARMSSTRLPGKVLMNIENKPMLYHVVKQTLASKLIDDVVIATTTYSEDDAIEKLCKQLKLKYFRGSKNDLLDRYYKCAKKFKCDIIVRITSDCPFIDPDIIDMMINKFLKNSYDYVSNNVEKNKNKWKNSTCNFPQGMTVEVSSFPILEKAWKEAKKPSEREHVFPYVQFHPKLFKISNIIHKKDISYLRCTVDRKEDLKFVQEIYKRISKQKKVIRVKDILRIANNEPDLPTINNWISFDEGYKKSLLKDKKSTK